MTHPLTEAARVRWESRLACELCGEDHVELRVVPTLPNDSVWCRACYGIRDEADFTDFPMAQEAMK